MVVRERGNPASQTYTYAAEPTAIASRTKAKYREDEPMYAANIMFDRRVVRGNTYAAQVLPAEPYAGALPPPPAQPPRRRKAATRKPSTPPPAAGRQHMDVQTDAFLEELTDVVPEAEAETQTDVFLERPVTPLFVPQKHGIDADTQIEDGELFDFEVEVEPILEVMVGKVLEQGLMEVLEEEELAAMRAHQQHFEQVRAAELAATQKLEAAERRKAEERQRRKEQERERLRREAAVRAKVAACTFARGCLAGVVDSVVESLWRGGYFYDVVERAIEEDFVPWLWAEAERRVEEERMARGVVAALLEDAAEAAACARAAADARRDAEAEALLTAQAGAQAARDARDAAQLRNVRGKAAFVLHELVPRCVAAEQVEEARAGLRAAAEEAAAAAWEEAKAAAGDAAREAAEAANAEALEAREVAGEGSEEEEEEDDDGAAAPADAVDVEQAVAQAMEKVEKPEPKEVTDGDVLSALLEARPELKDVITTNMAVQALGASSWIHDARFAAELEPTAE